MPLERTAGDVLDKYKPSPAGPATARACGPKRTRQVWGVAYRLPPKAGRTHATHTTAPDVTTATRDVLRHLPEGTKIISAEPTRRARRGGGTPRAPKAAKPKGGRRKTAKRQKGAKRTARRQPA